MFGRIGQLVTRHARAVLVITVLLMVGAGAYGFTAFGKLKTQGFADPEADSSQAQELIDRNFGGRTNLVFLVQADTGTVDDPAVRQAGTDLTGRLTGDGRLTEVTSYFATGTPPLRSTDGRYAIVLAHVDDDSDEVIGGLRDSYATDDGPVDVTIGGAAAIGHDAGAQIGADLALAESIAVPLILILLVFAFGSLVAALLPLAIGGIAILGTFAELALFGSITDVSIYAINLTTALGLGLAIDYALLMVNRFREELAGGAGTQDAVITTVRTAGRTILFGATTVAAALAVLLLFPLYFLRSFAYAGIGVIAIAALSALFVLPALLTVLGPRVNAGRLPWARRRNPSAVSPFWGRLAGFAMRRPVLAAAPVLIVLVLAAVPLLRVEFGVPDDRVLASTADTRVVGDALRSEFAGDESRAIQIVTTAPVGRDAVAGYAGTLSELPGVARVSSSAGGFVDGRSTGTGPGDAVMSGTGGLQRLSVVTEAESVSTQAQALVGTVRAVPGPDGVPVRVGGAAAVLVDSKDSIGSRLPLAVALIVLTTFVLLFLFSGSVLQPLRAVVFNVIGLGATLGAMVLIFQDGAFASALGFTPLPLNINMLVLLFCIAFGLSIDYEVFVLSRIKEMHDQGVPTTEAVGYGLSRTGRIVSTAAALIAVSMFAFGTSGVSFIQLFGIGTGLAILIDATLIRGVLVPVGMRLLGRGAWWAPGPLRRIHERVGLREAPSAPEPERVGV
ncbi:MAG TPA: MMPL family transporter [Actinophytocola sp.]|uniref:MMPL family transporter n=1 Tax=Actinophytocola sp. TaxID=1872138 RepID=UPI002DBB47B8|nr:MMPL family transporter [Actinophytocola sp.]HEU5474826.1 MMPL family transporter [Actinophytocola sp.]